MVSGPVVFTRDQNGALFISQYERHPAIGPTWTTVHHPGLVPNDLCTGPCSLVFIVIGKLLDNIRAVLVREEADEFLARVPARGNKDDRYADDADAEECQNQFGTDGAHGSFPFEPISHAIDGLDIIRLARICLDLAAQILDVCIDRSFITFVADALDDIQQVEAGIHPTGR
jgi:hypothetical protein